MWLRADLFDVELAWAHNLNPRLHREIRKIIFEHFDLIVEEWERHFGGEHHAGN